MHNQNKNEIHTECASLSLLLLNTLDRSECASLSLLLLNTLDRSECASLSLLPNEGLVYVRDNAAAGDGCLDQGVQLFISPDSQL